MTAYPASHNRPASLAVSARCFGPISSRQATMSLHSSLLSKIFLFFFLNDEDEEDRSSRKNFAVSLELT
jgi:hypothetical protein